MVVRTNVLALNSHRNLGNVGRQQQTASARLSSGFRINSAADDAAGLGISENMRAQIRGLDQASRNAQDAISLIQTAEGGMNTINEMVIRIRELTVQAANDINTAEGGNVGTNESNRARIQQEINHLVAEIGRTADTLQFNGMTLLDGSLNGLDTVNQAAIDTWIAAQMSLGPVTTAITNAGNAAVAGNAAANAAQNALNAAASLISIRDAAAADLAAAELALAGIAPAPQTGAVADRIETLVDQINDALTAAFAEFNAAAGLTGAAMVAAPQIDITANLAVFRDLTASASDRTDALGNIIEALQDFTTFDGFTPQVGYAAVDAGYFGETGGPVTDDNFATEAAAYTFLTTTLGIDSGLATELSENGGTIFVQLADGRAQEVTVTWNSATDIDVEFGAVGASVDANAVDAGYFGETGGPVTDDNFATEAAAYAFLTTTLGIDSGLATELSENGGTIWVQLADGRAQEVTVIWNSATDIDVEFGAVAATVEFEPASGQPPTNWNGIDFTDFGGTGTDLTTAATPGTPPGAPGSLWARFANSLSTIGTTATIGALETDGIAAIQGATAEEIVARGWVAQAEVNLDSANDNLNAALGMTAGVQNTVAGLTTIVNAVRNPAEAAERTNQLNILRNSQAYRDIVADNTEDAIGTTMWFQVGANSTQGITLDLPNVIVDVADALSQLFTGQDWADMRDTPNDIGTNVASGAIAWGHGESISDLLDGIDTVFAQATAARGELGALQNRLEFTTQNLDVSSENLSAANSRIRDADMALEMMRLTQANVLQQAATAMLAQGNQAPQSILQLLG